MARNNPNTGNNYIITAEEAPYNWIRKELLFDREYRRGDKGKKVKILQEWLSLHGHNLAIDGQFGPATEHGVRQYQKEMQLNESGVVDQATFAELIKPMLRALTPMDDVVDNLGSLVVRYARQHLAEHPREIGGQNSGPWVRLYMLGNEGREWAWCAGFVCFVLRQASQTMEIPMPFRITFSCDTLAAQAKEKNIFVSERNLSSGNPSWESMLSGSIFLNRRTATDWIHTGLVSTFNEETLETIEGNTNDDGDREGYEVCTRIRGYRSKDFIRIT